MESFIHPLLSIINFTHFFCFQLLLLINTDDDNDIFGYKIGPIFFVGSSFTNLFTDFSELNRLYSNINL